LKRTEKREKQNKKESENSSSTNLFILNLSSFLCPCSRRVKFTSSARCLHYQRCAFLGGHNREWSRVAYHVCISCPSCDVFEEV